MMTSAMRLPSNWSEVRTNQNAYFLELMYNIVRFKSQNAFNGVMRPWEGLQPSCLENGERTSERV